MSRETKFGLLLVCILTSVFGILVYKRMHKPADLVAGDHDPAAVAVSDRYPTGKPEEAPSQPETPAAAPNKDAVATADLLTAPPRPETVKPTPTKAPAALDLLAVAPVNSKVVPTKPAVTQKLPIDLDDEAFFSPPAKPATPATPVVAKPLPDQSEPDPFAAEPAGTATVSSTPVETSTPAPTAIGTQPVEEFDPFASEPPQAAPVTKAQPIVNAKPAAVEEDPFAQEPPRAEPVTVSSRNPVLNATPVTAAPVAEIHTFDPEPQPVPVAKPAPIIAQPVAESFGDPFAAPQETASTPAAAPVMTVPVQQPASKAPVLSLDVPETKTAATVVETTPDPLDFPPAKAAVPVEKPLSSPARQPQTLPIDLDFAPAATPVRPVPTTIAGPSSGGYVVEPGDNFWIISKKLYGTGRYFQALANHNSQVVTDPSKMKPGLRIAAPSAAELDARYAAVISPIAASDAPAITTASSVNSRPVAASGFFVHDDGQPMYRVGSEDTLSGIAFNHLGRASRWVQIFEMNRQVLKDGNTLKVGSELRLPADASQVQMTAGATGRR